MKGNSTAQASAKDQRSELEPESRKYGFQSAIPGPHAFILGLQRAVGNRAVTAQVQAGLPDGVQKALRSSGRPLDPATRAEMEGKFGHEFGEVRLHLNPLAQESARMVGANAYTVGRDVVFAAGQYRPNTRTGQSLLAHELAHVIQQSRGGPKPPLDPGAATEQGAEAAARAAVTGGGPIVVSGATGVGLARAVDDWLVSTPNYTTWSYSELQAEIDTIEQWLGYQIQSSEETVIMENALQTLRTELGKRQTEAFPPPKKKGRRRRRGRKGKRRQKEAVQIDAPELQMPRILQERTSVQYTDPAEIREQVDLIMAWLRRKDLSPDDRDILQTELQSLAPSFEEERLQQAAERRASKIQQALTPQVKADARIQLVDVVRLIDGIKPLADRPGYSYLMFGDEMIVLHDSEAAAIQTGITKMMGKAVEKIKGVNESTMNKWSHQAKVEREEAFAGWVVSLFTGTEAPDVFDKMDPFLGRSAEYLSRYRAMGRQDKLVQMAEAIGKAEENAVKARLIVDGWIDESLATAAGVVTGLTITRDLSFSIVTSYFGGAGFLSLTRSGMGLMKAGLTVTAAGTTAMAGVRGGSNLAGQALAGGPIDVGEVTRESLAGAKRGAVDTLTGLVTAGTASALGQGTTFTGRVVRGTASGAAGGATGGGVEAALEGKSVGEVLESTGKGGLAGGLGGGLSSATAPWLSSRSQATRFLTGTGTGAAGGAGSALLTGGSAEDIKQAAITGGITGGVTAAPSPQSTGLLPRQRQSKTALTPEGQLPQPVEIIGDPVRIPGPAQPVLGPRGEPARGASFRRPPDILAPSGQPARQRPPRGRPTIFGPTGQPANKRISRRQRPTILGPTGQPAPLSSRQQRGQRARRSGPAKPEAEPPSILGPTGEPVGGPTGQGLPPILGPRGMLARGQPGPGVLLDPTGQQVIPGARVRLESPLTLKQPLPPGPTVRGQVVEPQAIRQRYPRARELPPNFEAFDAVEGGQRTPVFAGQRRGAPRTGERIEGGRVISLKSIDLSGKSYSTGDKTFDALKKYVDDAVNYPRGSPSLSERRGGQPHQVTLVDPSERILHLELTGRPNNAQMEGLARLQKYARDQNIKVVIVAPQGSMTQ